MATTEMTDSDNQTAQQDESAVAAVRGGDAERYRELVERHERRVYAVAWSRLGDAALAEEATQEAFIRAYRRLWLLGDGAKFSGWVNTIARRVAINFGLRHRRELNKRERWALENPGAPPPKIPLTKRRSAARAGDSAADAGGIARRAPRMSGAVLYRKQERRGSGGGAGHFRNRVARPPAPRPRRDAGTAGGKTRRLAGEIGAGHIARPRRHGNGFDFFAREIRWRRLWREVFVLFAAVQILLPVPMGDCGFAQPAYWPYDGALGTGQFS